MAILDGISYRLWVLLGDTLFRGHYEGCVTSLSLGGDERVMDFGCGPGVVSRHFARFLSHGHLTCVDISETAIRIVEKRLSTYENVDFVTGDIREAGLATASYDVIFLNFVYYHIDPVSRESVMAELVRLLREDGFLVIRNAVGRHTGMSEETIREEMAKVGLKEIRGEKTKSLFVVPTYSGFFQKGH